MICINTCAQLDRDHNFQVKIRIDLEVNPKEQLQIQNSKGSAYADSSPDPTCAFLSQPVGRDFPVQRIKQSKTKEKKPLEGAYPLQI
jgi:hypothetical protein